MAEENRRSAPEDQAAKPRLAADANGDGKLSVGESFGALKDRTLHARDLKQQKRAHDDLARQINDSSTVLEDNRYILMNYERVISEQKAILESAQKDLKREENLLKNLTSDEKEVSSSLNSMVADHRRLEED